MKEPAETCEMNEEQHGCGILLHQRPMLQKGVDFDDPMTLFFFANWVCQPDEELTDEKLVEATQEVDGDNLLFLKALVDGRPEIINVELPKGEVLTVERLREAEAEPTICVHLTDDPDSGFYLRHPERVECLAPFRDWKLYGKTAQAERQEKIRAALAQLPA